MTNMMQNMPLSKLRTACSIVSSYAVTFLSIYDSLAHSLLRFISTAGQESETLRITFYEFELEEPFQKGCLNDFVDISTISVANVKQLVGRFCGTYVPVPLLTMKPRMEIIFKANHARSAKGRYAFTYGGRIGQAMPLVAYKS